jgi:hypothetical protein
VTRRKILEKLPVHDSDEDLVADAHKLGEVPLATDHPGPSFKTADAVSAVEDCKDDDRAADEVSRLQQAGWHRSTLTPSICSTFAAERWKDSEGFMVVFSETAVGILAKEEDAASNPGCDLE